MDMSKWMGKSHEASTLHKEVYATEESWTVEGSSWGKHINWWSSANRVGRGLERREGENVIIISKRKKKRLFTSRTNNPVLTMSKDYIPTPKRTL